MQAARWLRVVLLPLRHATFPTILLLCISFTSRWRTVPPR
jgi:hypothetical protein